MTASSVGGALFSYRGARKTDDTTSFPLVGLPVPALAVGELQQNVNQRIVWRNAQHQRTVWVWWAGKPSAALADKLLRREHLRARCDYAQHTAKQATHLELFLGLLYVRYFVAGSNKFGKPSIPLALILGRRRLISTEGCETP